jgi:hypothetical protein
MPYPANELGTFSPFDYCWIQRWLRAVAVQMHLAGVFGHGMPCPY